MDGETRGTAEDSLVDAGDSEVRRVELFLGSGNKIGEPLLVRYSRKVSRPTLVVFGVAPPRSPRAGRAAVETGALLTGFLIPGLATWSRRGLGAPVETGTPVTFDAAAAVAEDTADFAASLPFCPAAIAAAVAVESFSFVLGFRSRLDVFTGRALVLDCFHTCDCCFTYEVGRSHSAGRGCTRCCAGGLRCAACGFRCSRAMAGRLGAVLGERFSTLVDLPTDLCCSCGVLHRAGDRSRLADRGGCCAGPGGHLLCEGVGELA